MKVKVKFIKELKVPLQLTLIPEDDDDKKIIKEAENLVQIETVSIDYISNELFITIRIGGKE